MRKDVTDLVALLGRSVGEIANAAVDNRDALLTKSFGEFETALLAKLEPLMPANDEPLAKGLNHIALFANALRDAARTVEAIKTGRPSWMSDSNGLPPEEVPPQTVTSLDRFIAVGVLTLRGMVNDTAELPDDEDDLERAQKAGTLFKIEGADADILVKVDPTMPDHLRGYLTDPFDMLVGAAEIGQDFIDEARILAEPFAETGMISPDMAKQFPEVFTLRKAQNDNDQNIGPGGDPDADMDPGDDQNANQDDDANPAENPIEMMVRMASIIVVLGGSILQNQPDAGANDNAPDDLDTTGETGGDASGMPDDTTANINPPTRSNPLRRQAPIAGFGDVALAKIFAGDVAVHPSVADALEELIVLRTERQALANNNTALANDNSALAKSVGDVHTELAKMKAALARLEAQPAAPKGALFAVGKHEEFQPPSGRISMPTAEAIEEMAKIDPERAAREMMKVVHAGGGTPMAPPGGR